MTVEEAVAAAQLTGLNVLGTIERELGDLDGFVHGNAAEWRLGIPLGSLADPADQAALAVFLAGDGARHITGQDMSVDGGQTLV